MTRVLRGLFATLMLSAFASTFAHAQSRTFVSSLGTDANACTVTAPCRTLQRGIDVVAAGGDVLIVDAGGFGTNVLIERSVSIFAPPGNQSRLLVAPDQTGITIDNAGISVSISNLGITGAGGTGTRGVSFVNGAALSLSHMDISISGGFAGIDHGASSGHLTMANTRIRNADLCLYVHGTSAALARATVVKSSAENCRTGFYAGIYASVSVEASSANGTSGVSFFGFAVEGPQSVVTLDGIVASNQLYGIYASNSDTTITVSNALLTGNDIAGEVFNGAVGRSYGNNRIFGNTTTDALTGFTSIAEQ